MTGCVRKEEQPLLGVDVLGLEHRQGENRSSVAPVILSLLITQTRAQLWAPKRPPAVNVS